MERGEEWYWTLGVKSDPETVIGLTSLSVKKNMNRGFWLGIPWHRQALMTEAVFAATDF